MQIKFGIITPLTRSGTPSAMIAIVRIWGWVINSMVEPNTDREDAKLTTWKNWFSHSLSCARCVDCIPYQHQGASSLPFPHLGTQVAGFLRSPSTFPTSAIRYLADRLVHLTSWRRIDLQMGRWCLLPTVSPSYKWSQNPTSLPTVSWRASQVSLMFLPWQALGWSP